LKDWGFTSTNDRAFISLLKAIDFLTADGKPTQRYLDYRDHSRSKQILGKAIRDAYDDIFLIKEHPTTSDRSLVEGKFKSFHNVTDNLAGLMAKTFYGLLAIADLSTVRFTPADAALVEKQPKKMEEQSYTTKNILPATGLHYNIQIHLPATKGVEVFNAIFKSLKDHLLD
jgi:Family of unknown function (DUF5343)